MAHSKEVEQTAQNDEKNMPLEHGSTSAKIRKTPSTATGSGLIRKKKSLNASNMSNSMAQMVRKQKSFRMEKDINGGGGSAQRRKESGEEYVRQNYYTKIPDLFELPITVVNNVLYSSNNWKGE